MQVERLPVSSREIKNRMQSAAPSATNAITKDLGALLNEVERWWTNYLADARSVTLNIGKPLTGPKVNFYADRAGREAEKLFGLAREAGVGLPGTHGLTSIA